VGRRGWHAAWADIRMVSPEVASAVMDGDGLDYADPISLPFRSLIAGGYGTLTLRRSCCFLSPRPICGAASA
jgi:hypothetical protein